MTDMGSTDQRYAISPWLLVSFLLCVGLPSLTGSFYYVTVQSPVYNSEAKLSPRNRDESGRLVSSGLSSLMGQIGGANLGNSETDSYAVRDYVISRAIIVDLGGADQIATWFAAENADFLSAYDGGDNIESAWEFWIDHVTAFVDGESGLVRIRVNAYTPAAAKDLLDRIILASEDLLNQASLRARNYNVQAAITDFQRSLDELGAAQGRILDFQIKNSIVDPGDTVREITSIIGTLRLRRAKLQATIDSGRLSSSFVDPREAQRTAQIEAIDRQIANFEADLTSAATNGGKSLATMLNEYEPLRINLEFRNRMYELDSAALEKARNQVVHQQKYLMLVVAPVLSDDSSQQSSLASTLFLFAALTVCWGIVVLFIAAMRDS